MAGEIFHSPFSQEFEIPCIDIPSYVFSNLRATTQHRAQYFNAARPTEQYDLADALLYVKRFAKGLLNLGLQPGDKVLLVSPSHLYFPVALWGILAAQCVFTGGSPTASAFELVQQLKNSEAKVVIASQSRLAVAKEAAAKAGIPANRVFIFDDPLRPDVTAAGAQPITPSWATLWVPSSEAASWTWKTFRSSDEAKNTTAIINYSSGTTGLPKGVELTHYNLISNVEHLAFKRAKFGDNELAQHRRLVLPDSGERWLAALPMYHAFGQTYYTMLAPRIGAKIFIMEKFDPVQFLAYIDMYRITFINIVPAILRTLVKIPRPDRFNLKSVVMVGSGASPLDTAVARQFERLFLHPHVQIKQGWGMTETTCNVTGFAPDDVDDGRSIGWLNPGCAAIIVPVPDRDFSSLEREHQTSVGEIWVAGPNIMKGYWKNERATEDTIVEQDGYRWLRTGDVGFFDKRKCLYIVDRVKDLIKVNGLQVSPTELENALVSYPGVSEAVVTAVKISSKECPRAFVVLKDTTVTANDLGSFIRSKFAKHKWLSGGIYFLGALPRSASGKVVKRLLPDPTQTKAKL